MAFTDADSIVQRKTRDRRKEAYMQQGDGCVRMSILAEVQVASVRLINELIRHRYCKMGRGGKGAWGGGGGGGWHGGGGTAEML